MADFDGATYDRDRDHGRLTVQLSAVRMFLWDGRWHTLHEIASHTGHPEASISARIRDLRKVKFGGYDVRSRPVTNGNGLWEYRIRWRRTAVPE